MKKHSGGTRLLLPSLLLLTALFSTPAWASTFYVCQNIYACQYQTIQSAIDAAVDLDRILVWNGTYAERLDFKGKDVSVTSYGGPAKTIIDGGGSGTVVSFHSGETLLASLNGFTVKNGAASGISCTNGSSPVIENCSIKGNSGVSGGGIVADASHPMIIDCTISGNSASLRGGGVFIHDGYPVLVNCTVAGNFGGFGGDGITVQSSLLNHPHIANCILWGNGNEFYLEGPSQVDVTYSDIAGDAVWTGAGNILGDPRFVNPRPSYEAPTSAGDYHIARGSPCIDAGTYQVGFPDRDLEGEARYRKNGYDIGSDEFSNSSFEYGAQIPTLWTGKHLTDLDGRARTSIYLPYYCFKVTGTPANKSLTQEVKHGGTAGHPFTLSASSKAEGSSAAGGPYRVEATVYHNDGTTRRYVINFSRGTHDWESKEFFFSTEKDFSRVVIGLRYRNQTGTAWFDSVKLTTE